MLLYAVELTHKRDFDCEGLAHEMQSLVELPVRKVSIWEHDALLLLLGTHT